MTAVSAEQYIFRHKYPLGSEAEIPVGPEIEVGNDIVAYYTAPVGKPFSKRIPVKTTDVVNWRVVSGDAANGIDLDSRTGTYEGIPDVAQQEVQILAGYDAANNLIAKAEVHFNVVKPEGVEVKVSFFAHTNQYSYNVIPSPNGVQVDNWQPVMEVMPGGMAMRNEAFEGVPTQAMSHPVMWQGYDYLGRKVAYAWGDFVVTDGPLVGVVPDMSIDPARNQAFNYTPTVTSVLGSVSWKLVNVDGYRPPELTFTSIDGKISGQVAEFGMSKSFQLVVTDSYDGTSTKSNPFKLSTTAARFNMANVQDREFIRGVSEYFGLSANTNMNDLVWSLDPESSPLPDGLDVNPETGAVGGIAKELGEFPGIIVRVDGAGNFNERTNPFKITVFEKDIRLSTTPLVARIGKPFHTKGVTVAVGRVDPVRHGFANSYTPRGDLTIAEDSGVISSATGIGEAATFNIPIDVRNGDGQPARGVYQHLGIYPSITLSYADTEFKRFDYNGQASPTVNREALVGDVEFSVSPALPNWLKMDPYGRINIDYANQPPKSAVGFSGEFVVSVTDAEGVPVKSNSFRITLRDRDPLALEEQNGGQHKVERYVTYSAYNPYFFAKVKNGFLGYSYSLADGSQPLPAGLLLHNGGYLTRSTSVPAGEYRGIMITAVDGDGSSDTYGPFTLKVVADTGLKWPEGELATELTWVVGYPFALELPKPYNAREPISYTIKNGPAGLVIDDKGVLSGTVASEGVHEVVYEIDDDTSRDPITGVATLTVEKPFEFGVATWEAFKGAESSFTVPMIGGIKPFTFTHKNPGDLPKEKDWRHFAGIVRGVATISTGGFPVEIEVTDKAGVKKTFSTSVEFKAPRPLMVTWPSTIIKVGETSGLPKAPILSDKTVAVTGWALSGTLPDGIGFDSTTGSFYGNPTPGETSAGIHTIGVIPSPADPDVKLSQSPFDAVLKVGYSGDINFPSKTFKHRVNKAIEEAVSYSRAVPPLNFTAISVGEGVAFDEASAKFTATFAHPGTYTAGTIKLEENNDPAFNREKTSSFGFQIVPDLTVTVPESVSIRQYDRIQTIAAVTENVIGDRDSATPDVRYAPALGYSDLPSGLSVNPSTGAVEGVPEVFGEFGPFAITAFDAYGDSKNSNEFSVTIAERKQMTLSYATADLGFHRFDRTSAAPTVIDGYGPFSWNISPPPPAGVEFDVATGRLTARTTDLVPEAAYRVTVVDSKGGEKGTASADIIFGVAERPQLTASYPVSSYAFKRHNADTGIVATAADRVSMGGSTEYSIRPSLPSCIAFDAASGRISADCSVEIEAADYVVTVTDDTYRTHGSAFGRYDLPPITVSVGPRDPIKITYEGYDKVGQTFGFVQHKEAEGVPTYSGNLTDVTWSITPSLPNGLSFDDTTGTIHAKSSDPIPTAPYSVTIRDDKDGVTTVSLAIGVDKRKDLAFVTSQTQSIMINADYDLTLRLENQIGEEAHFELVSGDLPVGVRFDADGSAGYAPGTFYGSATAADHGKTFAVNVRATDDFDGDTGVIAFSLTVVEDGTPMKLTYGEPAKARVGYAYSVGAPKVENAIGNYVFTAPSLTQYGLVIDPVTGRITGSPNSTFDKTITVTVTDKLGVSREVTQDLRIVSTPSPRVEVSVPTNSKFNRMIPEEAQPYALDAEEQQTWTVSPEALPLGLTLDALSGHFIGKPEKLGTFGPYTLTMTDALPGAFPSAPFTFEIGMNNDPIELEELSVLTKVGFPFTTKAPAYDNNYGAAVFSSPELTGLGLMVDRATGVVSGKISTGMDVKPNLMIRDTTNRTTSVPVGLTILPVMRLTAPETITLTALDKMNPVSVTRTYVAGTAEWNAVDPTQLPEGVVFDTATGQFTGTPTKVQTLAPMTVSATDTFGDRQIDTQSSNPINFVVKKGAFYMAFAPGELPLATKRKAFSYDLVANKMFEFDGMDLSEIAFKIESLDNSKTPAEMEALLGIKVVNGVLTGTPADEGTFDFKVTATFSNRAPVSGAFQIIMHLPPTSLQIAAGTLPEATKNEAYSFDFRSLITHTNIPYERIVWDKIVPVPANEVGSALAADPEYKATLPAGVQMAAGVLSGVPTESGKFAIKVPVAFSDRSENLTDAENYTIVINGKSYRFIKVAAGGTFSCGVTTASKALCWGNNSYNQLGVTRGQDGLFVQSLDPVEPTGIPGGIVDIAAGNDHACAVNSSGSVYCWGRGYPGNGTLNVNSGSMPVRAGSLTGVVSVATGNLTTCAVTSGGNLWCWGHNSSGQVGNNSTQTASTPVQITSMNGITRQVALTSAAACAVTTSGGLKCWGDKAAMLGFSPQPTANIIAPRDVPNLAAGVKSVAVGDYHGCAVMETGTVKCWGDNGSGQLGRGNFLSSLTPVDVVDIVSGASSISVSRLYNSNIYTSCAVVSGNLKCWGNYLPNAVSLGAMVNRPKDVSTETVSSLDIGTRHGCIATTSGKGMCWGNNGTGQLGSGDTKYSQDLTLVKGL